MRWGAAAVLIFAAPIVLQAQASARVAGMVQDSAGKAIGDVGVLLLPGGRGVRTDLSGRFRFDSITPGQYKLHFRRLGFLPYELPVALVAGADTTVDVTMRHRPRLLDTVVVASDGCSRHYFDGFLCRRGSTRGILTHSRCITTLYNGKRGLVDGDMDASTTMVGAAGRTHSETDFLGPRDLIGVEIYPPGYITPIEYGGLAIGNNGDRRAIMGSPFRGYARRVSRPEERCVLVNYWTTAALRDPRRN